MANDLTVNPMYIDTPGAGVLLSTKIFPKSIRWVGPGTAGDGCIVTDKNGNTVWRSVCSVDGGKYTEAEQLDANKPWDGLKVTTLTSGVLFISLKHNPPAS